MWTAFLDHLPRGHTLEEADWQRRHRLLLRLLAFHVPGLAVFGVVFHRSIPVVALALVAPAGCLALGMVMKRYRRTASVIVTGGLVYSSSALVVLTNGAIEAHFHFFIMIGFIALYQDWAPFLFNILFMVVSHALGAVLQGPLVFGHATSSVNPWLWTLIHGVAVLFACFGMMLFWRVTEESQEQKNALARQLGEAELNRRQFTSDLLVNLARRNQSMLYRQLDIINQLEESERDPDALAELFKLDHLATRVRRNAESLLVLSGEQPPRTWSNPVPLRDIVRAAIAETEDLERVVFILDERPAVAGNAVTDLTHLLAELTENAVRFSPPDSVVTIRSRTDHRDEGGQLITIEDWGVGMPTADLVAANALLAEPPEVDLSVSQRLGFHVVARLAARHGIRVSLNATPGSGITCVVAVPSPLFDPKQAAAPPSLPRPTPPAATAPPAAPTPPPATAPTGAPAGRSVTSPPVDVDVDVDWTGWWERTTEEELQDLPARAPASPAVMPGPSGSSVPRPRTAETTMRSSTPASTTPQSTTPASTTPPSTTPPSTTPPAAPQAITPQATQPRPAAPPPAVPSPAPRFAADPPTPRPAPEPVARDGGLRRRVPQAHLAPGLRTPTPENHAGPAVPPAHTAEAADALSRYQASRRAARAAVNETGAWK